MVATIALTTPASFFLFCCLFSSSLFAGAAAADVAAKLPSGSLSAGFIPFTFGGVHSQKG